jgi:cobalt-zinc-cadmium efflux system outer membrane protein
MKHIKTVFFLFSFLFVLEGNAQQLQTLINESLANNPEIQKFELQYKSKYRIWCRLLYK